VEGLAVDLLRRRVVDDVAALDAVVLVAQPRVDPEALDADDLLLFVAHRSGDVHDVDDHRVALGRRDLLPRAVALVLARRNDGTRRAVDARADLAAERLLVGALEVAQRLGARALDCG